MTLFELGAGLSVALAIAVAIASVLSGRRLRAELAAANQKLATLERSNRQLLAQRQEQAALERAVAQSERLESVGRLAGSVAHDFNNLLQGVRANVELAAETETIEDARELLEDATDVIDRAQLLTRNLLQFSRGQPLDREFVDLHQLLEVTTSVCRCIIGGGVELDLDLGASEAVVHFNPAQLEQIVLNLVVNAADAMPEGGRIRLHTRDRHELHDKPMLELVVSDSGQGIRESIQSKIFHPYFTTKGTGTGIGLATVSEYVRDAGGDIRFESEVGRGTSFYIGMPLHRD